MIDDVAGRCDRTGVTGEPGEDEIRSRRAVLRGALAFGCGCLLPFALSGCDSKKGAAPESSAPAGSSAPTGAPAAPAAQKATQASVQYQKQPKGDQKCANCVNFIAESNTCKVVEGQISPEGWCMLWVKKA